MTSILISIRPEWVAKILNGQKTIEIRKTAPKEWEDFIFEKSKERPKPMTGYIYCTKGKDVLTHNRFDNTVGFFKTYAYGDTDLNGKVVAKFTLREVEEIHRVGVFEGNPSIDAFATNTKTYAELLEESCLKKTEIDEYLTSVKKTVGYAWHISDLVIFDEPKELGNGTIFREANATEFSHKEPFDPLDDSNNEYCRVTEDWHRPIYKAPQSWCYVEVRE